MGRGGGSGVVFLVVIVGFVCIVLGIVGGGVLVVCVGRGWVVFV